MIIKKANYNFICSCCGTDIKKSDNYIYSETLITKKIFDLNYEKRPDKIIIKKCMSCGYSQAAKKLTEIQQDFFRGNL